MEWNRSEAIALAKESCTRCAGHGMVRSRGVERVCNCVLRSIFKSCYERFRNCVSRQHHVSTVRLEHIQGAQNRMVWGRKDEEFIADFCLMTKRTLGEGTLEHRIFKFHYLLGADWKMCCKRLNMDRGTFFHHVYRIQQALGKAFRETQPYGLFPLDEYFGNTVRTERVQANIIPINKVQPVRPPLAPTVAA